MTNSNGEKSLSPRSIVFAGGPWHLVRREDHSNFARISTCEGKQYVSYEFYKQMYFIDIWTCAYTTDKEIEEAKQLILREIHE